MVVIFGTRLLGATDYMYVPGVFHVATKFFHIDFIPLVPLGSYIVLKERFGSFQGVEIPLNCKSISIAWLRALGWIGVFATFIWLTITADDAGGFFYPAFGMLLVAILIASLFTWHGCTNKASYARASELSSELGPRVGPLVQRLVDSHFGEVAFQGVPSGDEEENTDSLDIPVATKVVSSTDQESAEMTESPYFENEEYSTRTRKRKG